MTKIPARPAAIVPPRPAAAKPAVAAVAPPVTAPPAVAVEVSAPETAAAESPTTSAPAADGATQTPVAPATTGKRRGRKAGSGAQRKTDKVAYHGLFNWQDDGAGGQTVVMVDDGTNSGTLIPSRRKLDGVPTDFDPKKNDKLRSNDFTSEEIFCDFQQSLYQRLADSWKKKAVKIRAVGNATDKKKALKYIKMREQLEALRLQLEQSGGDMAALESDDSAAA